jgi:site-specific DNA-methyltransferase (adenine-specific)
MHLPYFQQGGITLYHAKVEDAFYKFINPEEHTIISDPPYNLGYHYDECEDSMDEEAYFRFMGSVFGHTSSVIIHYPEAMYHVAKAMNLFPERVVAWVYPSNTPRQHRSVAWFGCKPDFRKDGQPYKNPTDPRIAKRIAEGKTARLYDWWEINQVKNVSGEKTEHPCQIPVALMERIIRITPGESILDPFAGSGTTLLAAQNLGRKAVGIEMSEKYCEIIANRLTKQARLI